MKRRLVNALPALLLILALLGAWELYADSGATSSSILPAPHTIAQSLWSNADLLSHNLAVTAEEVVLGLALALALGFALGVLIHLSPPLRRACYPLTVGSQAVPIAATPPSRLPAGLRPVPQADRNRPDLLLPGARHDRQRARRREPRPAEAAAHARRLAPAGLSLRRAPRGAPRSDQRRPDRRHRRRDRRLHRRVPDGGAYAGLGHEINADLSSLQTSRAYAAAVVLFAFAIACFYTLSVIERRLAPSANQGPEETSSRAMSVVRRTAILALVGPAQGASRSHSPWWRSRARARPAVSYAP